MSQLGWWHSQLNENKSNVPNHQPVKKWGKEQINSTKKRYKRLLRCFDGKSHVVKKGLTRVNFESCWDHELFGTWTCQPSWNFPGTGVARPDGVAVMNQRRDTRINQHPQSHSPKNVWQYYFGLVPPYSSTWLFTPYSKTFFGKIILLGGEKVIWFWCFWPDDLKSMEQILYNSYMFCS